MDPIQRLSYAVRKSDFVACESLLTPGRRQSKTLSTIDEQGSKIDRNSVFDSHLSSVWRQMAIKHTVSIDF